MITEFRKWLHNRKYDTPMCPCGWKMIPSTRQHFEQYWICKWKECTWEAFATTSYRIRFWKSQMGFLLHSKMVRDMVTNLLTKYIEECRENDSTDHTQFVKDLFTYLRYGELSKNFKKSEKK